MITLFIFISFINFLFHNNWDGDVNINPPDSLTNVIDLKKPKGITFEVSKVKTVDTLLAVYPSKKIFENKIGKEIMFLPEEQKKYALADCPNNGLIQTIQECFDNHRPLILSPDIIWLAICQGASIHINEKYDSLKNVIFIKDKPEKLEFREDSLEYKSKSWERLISSLSNETKKYTKSDFYSFYVSKFSTTTEIEKTAYQITILESYKKAFNYVGATGCGIPFITIAGEKSDWETILKKLDKLNEVGLSRWAKNLKPIIKEFVNVFDGKIDKEFWQSIYKNASEYNAFYISGWIIKFFPYTKIDDEGSKIENGDTNRYDEKYLPNEFLEGDRYLLSTLSTDNFPTGISKIDIKWINYFKNFTKDIEVYAGFFAIKQYNDKSIEPLISWVISEKTDQSSKYLKGRTKNLNIIHNEEYWSPHICEHIVDSAIYDIKKFKTQKASIDYIKSKLEKSILNAPQFNKNNLTNINIKFLVLSNGGVEQIKIKLNYNNQFLNNYIKEQITKLPEKWFPALAHPKDVLGIETNEEQDKLKVRANSEINIVLFEK